MTDPVVLAGVDLAWRSEKNPSAIAIGTLEGSVLTVDSISPSVCGVDQVFGKLADTPHLKGVAIDAPLIIVNETGQRECEREIGKVYGSRKASCHTSNLTLYPNANSVSLSNRLIDLGFQHLGEDQWQIECYPHPAIIEMFGLNERLKYKKGKVQEKREGQIGLAALIRQLENSNVVALSINDSIVYTDETHIRTLSGQSLKSNEDALDAIICLYIAAMYELGIKGTTFGDNKSGHVWIPQTKCS